MVQPEPAHAHGSAATTAVVLCNLGTPPIDAVSPSVRFEVMRFGETQRQLLPDGGIKP